MEGGGSVPELPETFDSDPLQPEDLVPSLQAKLVAAFTPGLCGTVGEQCLSAACSLSWGQCTVCLCCPSHLLFCDGHKQVLDPL